MNKVTPQEFNERVKWNLQQKIDHSLYIIDSFLTQYPNCVISYSGGIDSTVLLYLVRIIDKNRKGVFVNTTNEHLEILKFVKETSNIETIVPKITFIEVVEKYGFPLVSKNIARMLNDLKHPTKKNAKSRKRWETGLNLKGNTAHFLLSEKWKFLINQPFDVTNKCCYFLKKKPFKIYEKGGVIIGTLATESRDRKFSYLRTGCINIATNKCIPLAIWTKKDIWDFIKQNNIPYCKIYDMGESSTGCAYCAFGFGFDPTRFERLKKREPKRYRIMMNLKNNEICYGEALRIVSGKPYKGMFDEY